MPPEKRVTRKLRAILSADVKGYSILMADDEIFTIKTIKEYRDIMSHCIEQHNGRVVDSPGDNVLSEFASAVDAVQCAVEIQKQLKKENERLVEEKRLEFRIGVNIGDVVQDEDRIYGDGVNIASRIEGLADPAGICVSRSAYDQIKKKLGFGFEYMGEHPVKNISEPVRVYKVLIDSDSPKPLAAESLELPDKPSIAVLPFDNMSGDQSQEYFSDGLTEQIINGLCKVTNLLVIGRNSSFVYKGKSITTMQIAKELSVRYILEGSVQKAGDRIRITAQLIDATTDYHMWSENYDRDLEDIFALQDEITMKIITLMQVKLTDGDQARSWSAGTSSLKAYFHALKGLDGLHRGTIEGFAIAIEEAEKAITVDPAYSAMYALLGGIYAGTLWYETGPTREHVIQTSEQYLEKAVEYDARSCEAYIGFALLNCFKRRFNTAINYGRKAIELSPNNAWAYMFCGYSLFLSGESEEALSMLNKSFRLDPIPSNIAYVQRGEIYFDLKEYKKAVNDFQRVVESEPDDIWARLGLIASFQRLGMKKAVSLHVKKILENDPNFSLDAQDDPTEDPESPKVGDYWNALREAGLN